MTSETIDIDKLKSTLPAVIRAFINALGLEKATDFLIKHGGTVITVPKKKGAGIGLTDEELATLRKELALYLPSTGRKEWTSDPLSVPKVDKILMQYRNNEIRSKRKDCTLNQLALLYKLTRRQIININKDDNRQSDIFSLI